MSKPAKAHTDSCVVEHHEDGTWTTTTVVTERPATRAEQAGAWAAIGGLTLVTFSPVIVLWVSDWRESRRRRKEETKKPDLKSVED